MVFLRLLRFTSTSAGTRSGSIARLGMAALGRFFGARFGRGSYNFRISPGFPKKSRNTMKIMDKKSFRQLI
jgi:hypothetical protein